MVVNPGEIVGLIGPNGSGKTSLLDAISGFVKPASGAIYLGGTAIDGWPAYRRARAGIARTFQSLELSETETVRENLQVAFDGQQSGWWRDGVKYHRRARGRQQSFVSPVSLGVGELDTRIVNLPYGRRRIAALARAMAVGPAILLLDEPAAGLSSSEALEFGEAVRHFAKTSNTGVLLVEHNIALVSGICDRVAVMNFGQKIADGAPEEIRADPAVTRAYLGDVTSPRRSSDIELVEPVEVQALPL
jgi:sulfate-transporting ATPase